MIITGRIQKEKERKKQEIIEAAEKLFFSEGIKETSMDDIAKYSEFSKRTLYKYFGSKEELYSAIAYKGLSLLTEIINQSCQNKTNGYDKLNGICFSIKQLFKKNKNYFRIISFFMAESLKTNCRGYYIDLCKQKTEDIMNQIHTVFMQGIEDNSIKKFDDIEKTIVSLKTIVMGLLLINQDICDYLYKDKNIKYEDIFENTLNIIFDFIKNK